MEGGLARLMANAFRSQTVSASPSQTTGLYSVIYEALLLWVRIVSLNQVEYSDVTSVLPPSPSGFIVIGRVCLLPPPKKEVMFLLLSVCLSVCLSAE